MHARILMGDGSRKRLADIQTGDTVISHTGAARKVLAVFEQGMLPVLKLTTATGRTTTAAYDHPFLTTEGWKAARDLVPGNETLLADPIVAVEPAGEAACRCITVEEDHTFTADDLVVHNSALPRVRYPAYRLERDPQMRVILGCYGQSLANLFSRQTRKIATDRGIRGGEVKAQDEWETIGGGSFRAVGVGGGITGRGADLIIIDDPIRSREEANSPRWRDKIWDWYTNDIYSRREPGAAIILIQTRWHEDDLAGRILASDDGPNWTVIMLPAEAEADDPLGRNEGKALNPARFDIEALHEIKRVMGLDYYALYQQRPMAAEGGLYKKTWFRYISFDELLELEFEYILQAWDTASSELGDWSVCVTAGIRGSEVYILDVFRGRIETPDLLRAVKDQAAKWGPRAILVEDAASGIAAAASPGSTTASAAWATASCARST